MHPPKESIISQQQDSVVVPKQEEPTASKEPPSSYSFEHFAEEGSDALTPEGGGLEELFSVLEMNMENSDLCVVF
ncbi:MAG: hypothetical protein V2I33_22080, partial [Kangiellaceae bacterium]|nr:hypothetical protein [Kangiellaceae bacterium]